MSHRLRTAEAEAIRAAPGNGDRVHIELTEMLRCPESHDEGHVVLATAEMKGRLVRRGTLGCPVCRREFLVVDGVVSFGRPAPLVSTTQEGTPVQATPEALHAFLGLTGPGGYVVVVGSAAAVAPELAELIGGVHLIGINAPPGLKSSEALSLLTGQRIPLRTSMARGVVIGTEYVREPWLDEGVRVLLRGQRFVVLDDVGSVPGVAHLAHSEGVWVGQKR